MCVVGCKQENHGGPHLLRDERAREGDGRPEEDATAEDHLPIESVTQVAEDGGSHHEAADEHCGEKRGELEGVRVLAKAKCKEPQLSLDPEGGSSPGRTPPAPGTQSRRGGCTGLGDMELHLFYPSSLFHVL